MRRPATIALLALAAGAGAALFTVSYDVTEMEDRLATLNHQIVTDQEAIHVLRAEWSFLNQPARLEELSQRYLNLQPLTGSQIGNAAMLPVRLGDPAQDPAAPAGGPSIAHAAANDERIGAQPQLKPFPPARAPATPNVRRAATYTLLPPTQAEPLPVSARSLNDVLADLTQRGGSQR